MLRAAILLLTGHAAGSLLGFARGLIVARLISLADFGIASTLGIAAAVIDMMSALGLQQQIVQAKDGDDPRLQAALQGFALMRGLVNGAILFALARPMAEFMRIPEAVWGYQAMALVPVLTALNHLDTARLNRQMVFGPAVLVGVVPMAASLLAVWPLSRAFGDWRVMLYAILIQVALGTLTSHLVARRPYRIAFDRAIMARSLRFGWPLVVNNVLLFLVFNGDKLIVGRLLGMEALAIYAMGVTLTLTPTLVLARFTQTFFLPLLSRPDRDTPEGEARFGHLATVAMQMALLNGVLLLLAVALVGGPLVLLLLGERYAPLTAILTAVAAIHAVRVFKTGGAVVALSRSRTGNAMWANLVRAASLPLAWAAIEGGGGLEAAVAVAIAAEAGGYAVSLWLVRRQPGVSLRPLMIPAALSALFVAVALLPGLPAGLGAASLAALAVAIGVSMTDLRRYALRRFRSAA